MKTGHRELDALLEALEVQQFQSDGITPQRIEEAYRVLKECPTPDIAELERENERLTECEQVASSLNADLQAQLTECREQLALAQYQSVQEVVNQTLERAAEIAMQSYRDMQPDPDASFMDICMCVAAAIRAEITGAESSSPASDA